jgi:predicted GNAT family N-acyltransferase
VLAGQHERKRNAVERLHFPYKEIRIYNNMQYLKTFESFITEGYIMQDLEQELGIVLDLWDNGDHLELGKIEVPKNLRGTGVGSDAMQKIIDRADAEGKDIRLTPSTDFGATSVNRLEKFYRQFGFVKNKDLKYKDTMVRYAQ